MAKPYKPEENKMTEHLHIKMTPAERATVQKAAQENGMNVSQYCRRKIFFGEV